MWSQHFRTVALVQVWFGAQASCNWFLLVQIVTITDERNESSGLAQSVHLLWKSAVPLKYQSQFTNFCHAI